jgi:hypothetical protein
VALNAPMDALVEASGSPFPEPGVFRQDWYGRPFYSYVFETPHGAAVRYQGQGSDRLPHPELVFGLVEGMHRRLTGAAGARPDAPPLPSP